MIKKIARPLVHTVTDIRKYQYRQVKKFAKGIENKDILELGSGKAVRGKYTYSTKHLFSETNNFFQTDINESFGHPVVDVTTMKYRSKYDVVMCLNVLEHVYEFQLAVQNIHKALKKGGTAVIAVPVIYPLHDEPGDFWRFTEHSLKRMLHNFSEVRIIHNGKREFPFTYYVEAIK